MAQEKQAMIREPKEWVEFSEQFVQSFRVSPNEVDTKRLKQEMANPKKFDEFRDLVFQMIRAPEDAAPSPLRRTMGNPDEFPIICETFVQFFVKLRGDEALPRDLEQIVKEGREAASYLKGGTDVAMIEERLDDNETELRHLYAERKHLLSDNVEARLEAQVRERTNKFALNYRAMLQSGREAKKLMGEAKMDLSDIAKDLDMELPSELAQTDLSGEAFEEDPQFIAAWEAMLRERATTRLDTLRISLLAVEHLLGKYGALKRNLRLRRLVFQGVIGVVAVGLFLLALLTKPELGQALITGLGGLVVLFVGNKFITPWLDKRWQKLYRTHIKTAIHEYYPLRVRIRFLFAPDHDINLLL